MENNFSDIEIFIPTMPQCPECGAAGKRLARLNKRARPIGETWLCVCGHKFVFRTDEQQEIYNRIQKQLYGGKVADA